MNRDEAVSFIRLLHGHPAIWDARLWIPIWSRQSRRTMFHRTPEEAADTAIDRCRNGEDVYVAMGLVREPLPNGRRGSAADVAAVTSFWADIDVACDDIPTTKSLPASTDEAVALAHEMGAAPSITIHSGHGVQCFWIFNTPCFISTDEERLRVAALTTGWVSTVQQCARRHGWTLDPVGDLARVMRIFGAVNYKRPERPVPVTIISPAGRSHDVIRYPVDRLAALVTAPKRALGLKPRTAAGPASESAMAAPSEHVRGVLMKIVNVMRVNDQTFNHTWLGRRWFPSGRNSPSEYDMSMAKMLVYAGLADDAIAAIIYIRRELTGQNAPKGLRRDYVERTIRRARGG